MPTDLLAANNSAPTDLFAQQGINVPVASSYLSQLQQDGSDEWNTLKGDVQAVGAGLGNGLGGIATGGQQIANTAVNAINRVAGTNLPTDTTNYQNQFTGPANPTLPQKLLQGGASFVPYAAGGEAALPEKILGSDLLGRGVVGLGGTGAAYNQTMTPNPTALGDLKAAAANIAVGAPGMLASKALTGLAANQTPEALATNVAAADGTNTGLGAVLNSPTLQLAQKVGMAVPFGGGQGIKSMIADQVSNNGQSLLDGLSNGVAPQDVGASLQQALKTQLSGLQATKTQNYAAVNNMADNLGLNVGNSNAQSVALGALASINRDPRLRSTMDPGFIKDVEAAAQSAPVKTTTDPVNGTVLTPQPTSLKDANIYRGTLGDSANSAYQDGNMYQYGIYKSLRDGVGDDINSAITNSGSPELQAAHNSAQQFYAENIAPWEDPAIAKFARGGGDSDALVSAFVKPGLNNDRGNLISSLIDKLPDNQQSLPGYAYLSRANVPDPVTGNPTFDPLKFSQLYNNIGPNTKAALFGNGAARQQLDQYNNLVGMNKDILSANVAGTQHKALGGEALAALLGEHALGLHAVLGAAAGLAGGANVTNRLLTNPAVRNYVVNRIKNPVSYAPGMINKYTGGLGAVPTFLNNGQNQ